MSADVRAEVAADPAAGLSTAEARRRLEAGEANRADERTSRSIADIVRANVLTRFNAILGALLAVILTFGSPRDGLFGIVLVANALIGVVQELRAKRVLDRLSVLTSPTTTVVRDGAEIAVARHDVVRGDVVAVRAGDQLVVDGEVLVATGLEIDESLLTGESVPLPKLPGDRVLSGSFAVAGAGRIVATHVGADAYAHRLTAEARAFGLARSELRAGTDQILRLVTWAMGPVAALLLLGQLRAHREGRHVVEGVVAGLVAMVPEGLVLLTSMAFAAAVMALARQGVVVQELGAVEGLARVDVLCVDKTGTITDGEIVLDETILLNPSIAEDELDGALNALTGDPHPNATAVAIRDGRSLERPRGDTAVVAATDAVPFSSARKWSAARLPTGWWLLGAPEMLLGPDHGPVSERVAALAATGARVLLCARAGDVDAYSGAHALDPAALLVLRERVRPDAHDALAFFARQGVAVKVISGDNPTTVGAVAGRVGLAGAGAPLDARHLPTDPAELGVAVEQASVLGRVMPEQKKAIVTALQARGHVVAMTGDGVNDALALKAADIGVAMGSGAPVTRSVARLVLLDGRFAALPHVVAEGRRVIANIERVANLFVTKTVYSVVLAVVVGLLRWPFPFLPRHLTIIGGLTIGIPGFFLSFSPNTARYRPGFVSRVGHFAVPVGVLAGASTLIAFGVAREMEDQTAAARTVATGVLLTVGLAVLTVLARPLTPRRRLLIALMAAAAALAFALPVSRDFYELPLPGTATALAGAAVALAGTAAVLVAGTRALGARTAES